MTSDPSPQLLLSLSGHDASGSTSLVIDRLAAHEVTILDIGQAVIQDELSLGVLIELPAESASVPERLRDDLEALAAQLALALRLTPVDERSGQDRWQSLTARPDYILTLLAWQLTGQTLTPLTRLITTAGLSIGSIRRLSGQADFNDKTNEERPVCLEFALQGEPSDLPQFREKLLQLAGCLRADIAFQHNDLFRRHRRLVAFDMDSTLIETEVIDELARVAGVQDEVATITELAMQGQLPFRESLIRRVHLLEGLPEHLLPEVAAGLSLTKGASRLIRVLQTLGLRTAIISGGFRYFGEQLQKQLNIDYLYTNHLEVQAGRLTGRVTGEVIDGERKAVILRQIADLEGFSLNQVIAVGDGANDLPMLGIAGLGIAYRAKPVVRQAAEQAISNHGLDGILYLLGMTDSELDAVDPQFNR